MNFRTPWASAAVSKWHDSQSSMAWDIGAEAGVSLIERDGFPRRWAWVLVSTFPRVVLQVVQRRVFSWLEVRCVVDTYVQTLLALGLAGFWEYESGRGEGNSWNASLYMQL